MLQEQRSVWIYCYSSKKETLVYDKGGADVIRLDQRKTDECFTKKRGNEWYGIKRDFNAA
jgi:hypothetical protein